MKWISAIWVLLVDIWVLFGNNEFMAVTLYKRQRQIVEFISQFIQKNGYSPTLSEIAQAIGVSSLATIHEHLQALIKKKVLKKLLKYLLCDIFLFLRNLILFLIIDLNFDFVLFLL